jgi:L-asparaginase
VDVIYTYVDADGILIQAAVERAKAEGLVIAGFASGSPTPAMEETIDELAGKGVPIVLSQRAGMGRVKPSKTRPRLIAADNLTPQKARILLMLGLTKTKDPEELQQMFQEF